MTETLYNTKTENRLQDTEQQHPLTAWQKREASAHTAFDTLSEEQLLAVCRQADFRTLAIAVAGAGSEVIEKLKRLLSDKQLDTLLQNLESMHFIRSIDAKFAQNELLQLLNTSVSSEQEKSVSNQ